MSVLLAIIVGITIGLILGLTGAGGSVFAVPLLMLLLQLPAQQAIGISLGAVFISALFGVLSHLKNRNIQWLPAIIYASLGGALAPLGGWVGRQLNESMLLIGFSLLVLVIALRMWQQAIKAPETALIVRATQSSGSDSHKPACSLNSNAPFKIGLPCVLGISAGAIVTGLLSGLFGVGGGFLIIPTLIFITGIAMQQAVATSLVIISVISFSGFCAFLMAGNALSVKVLGFVALGGVIGMMIGIRASKQVAGPKLQKVFALLMVVMAIVIAIKQLF